MENATRKAVHLQTLGRLVLLLAVLVSLGISMLLFARMAEQRARWVQQALRVQVSLEHLAAEIRTTEDSERGYLLTGDERFLVSFQAAERGSREQISTLTRMTADNPRQRDNLLRLQPLVDARFSFLQSLIDSDGKRHLDPAANRAAMEQQRAPVGRIQSVLDAMNSEEERLLASREAALARARTRFLWVFCVGYGLIVFIAAWLYLGVRRYGRQSEAAEARLSQLNEQLEERVRERTARLKAREELLNTFVKHVPAAVAMLDRDMRYLQVSDRFCTEQGVSRADVLGATHYQVFPDSPDRWRKAFRRCLDGETLRNEEDRWIRQDGREIWLRWEIRPWGSADERPEGILLFGEDITERKQAEETLRESEATIRTLLDTASQAILAVNSSGVIVVANRMVGEMFGYSLEALMGKPLEMLIPERIRERHRIHRDAFAAAPKARGMGIGLDLVGRSSNGSEFPIEVSLSSLDTKRGRLAVSFVSDITVRKKAESDLRESEQKLRSLAASLFTAQEDERRTLARELHDDVTQWLALFSIELGQLASKCEDRAQERNRLQVLQAQAQHVSSEVRRLSHGLHPSVITDFGLGVALEEFCEEFEKSRGIQVWFEGPPGDERLKGMVATCLYRVAQESLRNAVVHGHATEIRVDLRIASDEIQLTVKDNGVGFTADPFQNRTGLGVVSMRERVGLLNGTLSITSQPGEGCQVSATVPLAGVEYDEI
ncbi:MAG TPA: PAS domain S-box protein [Acidobacteriaceae bacterium]|nr:PAS domain S-box protein [Acidobacteriaceae bacterium]